MGKLCVLEKNWVNAGINVPGQIVALAVGVQVVPEGHRSFHWLNKRLVA